MSVREYWEEECALCGTYHCENYFCYDCQIFDLRARIKIVKERPDREAILEQMRTDLRELTEEGK